MHIRTSDQGSLNLGFGGYTCNWGAHICGFYESRAERDEILTGFFHEGAESSDVRIYIAPLSADEDFAEAYAERYPCCPDHVSDSRLFSRIPSGEFYFPDGKFNADRLIETHHNMHESFSGTGKMNVRAAADMDWVHHEIEGIEHLMEYEAGLNMFYPGKPWVGICLYNLNKCSGSLVVNILRTHPYVISGGVVTTNPYYIDPVEYLKKSKNL